MSSPELPNWPFLNIDVTNSNVEQDEPMVVINPIDSLNVIIGANDDRTSGTLWAYSSMNGGLAWKDTLLPIPFMWMMNPDATDPSLAFTPNGEALYVNGHQLDQQNDVACFASSTKGSNWQMLSDVFQDSAGITDTESDKYFVTIDQNPASPYFGRIYVTWVELEGGSPYYVRIVSEFSKDNGISWSPRHYLSGLGHYIAPVPVAQPDGTLLISFEDYYLNNEIYVARSTDGGNTFLAPQPVAVFRNLGPLDPPDSTGYPHIFCPPDSGLNVNSFPAIAVDGSGAHPGRAYIVWCGKGTDNEPHVWLITSDNDGTTWSAPRSVDHDSVTSASARFFPWVAVDPTTGNVGIDYYTMWQDTLLLPKPISGGTLMMQAALYMLHSTDGGESFASRRISSAAFDPITQQDMREVDTADLAFFGDYIGIAGRSNTWYPAWTDARSGDDDIYTAIVQPFAPMPVTELGARDTLVNGKRALIVTWQYKPESTFGYPLPAGYQFDVAKDGTRLALQDSNELSFLDTNAQTGNEYEVTVLSGVYHSITDSIPVGDAGVAAAEIAPPSFHFLNSPAMVGSEDVLVLDCPEACKVSLLFFDAIGREIGPAVSDGYSSSHHEIAFLPANAGVRFFALREASASGTKEIYGKLIVEP